MTMLRGALSDSLTDENTEKAQALGRFHWLIGVLK